MGNGEPGSRSRLRWATVIVALIALMACAIWLDLAIGRLAFSMLYYLIVGPFAVAVAALVMKVLASALFGWHIRYSWLLAIMAFAFLALQILGRTNYLVYASVWRFSQLISLMTSAINLLILSAVVSTILWIVTGRAWRQTFLVTFAGLLGLSFLALALTRGVGLRSPGLWPVVWF